MARPSLLKPSHNSNVSQSLKQQDHVNDTRFSFSKPIDFFSPGGNKSVMKNPYRWGWPFQQSAYGEISLFLHQTKNDFGVILWNALLCFFLSNVSVQIAKQLKSNHSSGETKWHSGACTFSLRPVCRRGTSSQTRDVGRFASTKEVTFSLWIWPFNFLDTCDLSFFVCWWFGIH